MTMPPTDGLNAGGTTAMFDGLMNALREIVTNGVFIAFNDYNYRV